MSSYESLNRPAISADPRFRVEDVEEGGCYVD